MKQAGIAAGCLLGAGLLGLVVYAALVPDTGLLPYRLQAWLDNVAGEAKVMRPQADPEPAPWVGTQAAPEVAAPEMAAPAAEGAEAEAEAALLPVEAAAAVADAAIARYRASRDDPKLARAAEEAIAALRHVAVVARDDAARAAVLEVRDEKANVREHALIDARREARATHEVAGVAADTAAPWLVLRAAAQSEARDLGHLQDGDRLHQFLRTADGWARVEVLSGLFIGQNGYVKARFLAEVPAAGAEAGK